MGSEMCIRDRFRNIWAVSILVVSINTGAYMAESVRGGILSIDPGQTEGAHAIGMTHVQTMTYVILPQALRNIMPQIGNNLIINIKDTCVLSCISVVELFFASRGVAGAYYWYFETYTIVMVIYFILTFVCSRLLRLLEKRMDGPANFDLAVYDTSTGEGMPHFSQKQRAAKRRPARQADVSDGQLEFRPERKGALKHGRTHHRGAASQQNLWHP